MAIFGRNYDRDYGGYYGNRSGYGGGYGGYGGDAGTHYGYSNMYGYGDRSAYSGAYGDRDYYGGSGYGRGGYDRTYRRSPEQSETYGRGGDQAVQRWARRQGYDSGYTVRPGSGGRMGNRAMGYNRDYDPGRTNYYGNYLGYTSAGYDRGYRR